MKRQFPVQHQKDSMDCGPTCVSMIAAYYGKKHRMETLRKKAHLSREGVSLLGISEAAESIGFRTRGIRLGINELGKAPLPCILHWDQAHFVVLTHWERRGNGLRAVIADPALGLVRYGKTEFESHWVSTRQDGHPEGIALLLEPTPDFYKCQDETVDRASFRFLYKYLKPWKNMVGQLILGLFTASILQLFLPFLTQSIVDFGINGQDLNFIHLILVAQLMLTLSSVSVEFIRGWILLHLSSRINIALISDFLAKLMRLPMGYFESRMTGDILQRVNDHHRIEYFLSNSSLNTLFSLFSIVVFGIVLGCYNWQILLVFAIGSLLYGGWIWLFMKRRRELDGLLFASQSVQQSKLIQLVTGMQEIKLHGCERPKRWEWEGIQARLYKLNIKGLALKQYQDSGTLLINQVKNLVITAMAAGFVLKGEMSLGMMLSVQYILGQLNAPVDQLVDFLRKCQDARLSLERLSEVHQQEEEEPLNGREQNIPSNHSLHLKNITFSYSGDPGQSVLDEINLTIPAGQKTAIVGMSGSGKTTLIRLMLGYYAPMKGELALGEHSLSRYDVGQWRKKCGVVMQDGFIFSDSIAGNIAPGKEEIDPERLVEAAKTANIHDFITGLPLGYDTKIGSEGMNLSQGQKQRLLIARAVYKDPEFLFLDEATNALDANNERAVMGKLEQFFTNRTVVVVAHRLSTVRHADQIVVVHQGRIVESGRHETLIEQQGAYYNLVKNQLQL